MARQPRGLEPLSPIETALDWEDLVLDAQTRRDVETISTWIEHRQTLLEDWRLGCFLRPGYRALFYGPSGTGKRLTAALLGKTHGLPVYRVDLIRLVSQYIGETEKNLLDRLPPAGSCLLFAEVAGSPGESEREANQQIAYLLQRIDDYPGIVIVANNLRSHLDEAFARRFQSQVKFPMPDAEQRLALWRMHFADQKRRLADDVDFGALARAHEISGGDIAEVLRFACLRAVVRKPAKIARQDLLDGIRARMGGRKPRR